MRRWQQGLSLIEVVVALAIAAGAVALLYRVEGSALEASRRVQLQERALELAHSQLLQLREDPLTPAAGTLRYRGAVMHWRRTAVEVGRGYSRPLGREVRLLRLEVRVRWGRHRLALDDYLVVTA